MNRRETDPTDPPTLSTFLADPLHVADPVRRYSRRTTPTSSSDIAPRVSREGINAAAGV